MERKYLVPEWEGSAFQAWSRNYCLKNYWRVVSAIGDYNDCIAECALIWVECCRRYGATVTNNAWMMRMYQICVITTFDTKSMKDSNDRKLLSNFDSKEPAINSEAEMKVNLDDASSELKEVMKIFLNAPQEVLNILRADASSYHPMQFFKAVVNMCGISKTRSASLARELQTLLGK